MKSPITCHCVCNSIALSPWNSRQMFRWSKVLRFQGIRKFTAVLCDFCQWTIRWAICGVELSGSQPGLTVRTVHYLASLYTVRICHSYLDHVKENREIRTMGNFIICTNHQILLGRLNQGQWGGRGKRRAKERTEKCTGFWWESRKKDHLKDRGVDGKMGLNWS
jgi:hypothetical protein